MRSRRSTVLMDSHELKYKESVSSASVLTELLNPQDNTNFLKLDDMKENKILLRSLYIFIPLLVFGILALFFPIIYAVFPVQESEVCVCSFFFMG